MDAHRTTPIISITANAFEDDRQACLDAGMNDFVAKPVEPNTLYQVIAMALPTLPLAQTATPGQGFGVPDSAEDAWQTLPTEVREAPGWDAHVGLRQASADVELYLKLLRCFPAQHGEDAERIAAALRQADRQQALLLTHRLKGAAAVLGLRDLAEVAEAGETALRAADAATPAQAFDADQLVEPLALALQAVVRRIALIPEPGRARTETSGTVDETQILAVVAQLEHLLETDDTAAEDLFAAQADVLRQRLGEDAVAQLSDALDRFDYPMALECLRRQSQSTAAP
jgi:HPt (histidine-containing phosphotransfer) domain-containing protein